MGFRQYGESAKRTAVCPPMLRGGTCPPQAETGRYIGAGVFWAAVAWGDLFPRGVFCHKSQRHEKTSLSIGFVFHPFLFLMPLPRTKEKIKTDKTPEIPATEDDNFSFLTRGME